MAQDIVERTRDIAQLQLRLNLQSRLQLIWADMCRHIRLETLLKLRQVIHMHTQTRSVLMTTKIGEQVMARIDSCIHIKTIYRTSRTRDNTILTRRQHNRWTIIRLHQTRCHNTQDTLVPMRRIYHR